MYFICDIYDKNEYGKIKNCKELKELLISEVIDDLQNNIKDLNIVSGCINILESLAKGKDDQQYILDNLKGYGWKIIDLLQFQRDLEDLRDYFKNEHYIGAFNEVIDIINKGVNKNE